MWLILLTGDAVTFMLIKGKHTDSVWFHKLISLNKAKQFQEMNGWNV